MSVQFCSVLCFINKMQIQNTLEETIDRPIRKLVNNISMPHIVTHGTFSSKPAFKQKHFCKNTEYFNRTSKSFALLTFSSYQSTHEKNTKLMNQLKLMTGKIFLLIRGVTAISLMEPKLLNRPWVI